MKSEWVEEVLSKLRSIDVQRLSGGATTRRAQTAADERQQTPEAGIERIGEVVGRKNDDAAIIAARERYMARKASRGR